MSKRKPPPPPAVVRRRQARVASPTLTQRREIAALSRDLDTTIDTPATELEAAHMLDDLRARARVRRRGLR